MYRINIRNLNLYGYHGVNPEEKSKGQPFLFHITIDMADADFSGGDHIKNTVNYSEVIDAVKKVHAEKKFDLLETLAQRAVQRIFERFPLAERVVVDIKKIRPPIREKLDSVGVAYSGSRNSFQSSDLLLSLGSNAGPSMDNLAQALRAIAGYRGVSIKKVSSLYRTEPMYEKDQKDFFNLVAQADASKAINPFEFLGFLKSIEYKLGRKAGNKRYGPRPMDIDIIYWEGVHITSPFLTIPHPLFEERGFVLMPLSEIRPDFAVKGVHIKKYLEQKRFSQRVEKLDYSIQNDIADHR